MPELFDKAIVAKRNVLNELRSNGMTLQELRFFSIYLSKINPLDISTRLVRFSLSDFQKIMGFGKLNVGQLRESTDSLLCKIVCIPDENGRGMRKFQLFKECHLFQDDYNEWYIEIDAHDRALPLMFDFKEKYFKYELWNALRLKSANQLRMYEILKQYEKIGKREIAIKELRELLGIAEKEYDRWDNFKKKVLDSCQAALKETTDICYTYERGKTGAGGKWLTIIFHISKNKDFVDKLSLKEFIDLQKLPPKPPRAETVPSAPESSIVSVPEPEPEPKTVIEPKVEQEPTETARSIAFIIQRLTNGEFSQEQARELAEISERLDDDFLRRINRIKSLYEIFLEEALLREKMNGEVISDRFAYFRRMLEQEIEE